MIEIYKSSKHQEKLFLNSNLIFSPSAFLRRTFYITADNTFINDIHYPIEQEDDYILDKNVAFLDTQLNNLVALRTYSGQGELILSDKHFILDANTLIIFNHHQPRMHKTIGESWEFDWFEFHINELNIPLNTIIHFPYLSKEKFCRRNLLITQEKSPDDITVQGCFSFLLTIWMSHFQKDSSYYSMELKKCKTYIKSHLHENITIEMLAQHLNLSTRYFRKLFTEKYGISPKEYIENKRWEKAATLLTTTNLTLSQIAEACGLTSAYYFSVRFKQHFGVSPSKYRKTSSNNIKKIDTE